MRYLSERTVRVVRAKNGLVAHLEAVHPEANREPKANSLASVLLVST